MTYLLALIREGLRVAISSRVASTTTAFVTSLVVMTVFLSVGRAAVAEQDVVNSLEDAGSRVITVTATAEEFGLDRDALDRIGRLSGIERVVALGSVSDAENVWIKDSNRIPLRSYFGDLPPEVSLMGNRTPRPGEVIIGRDAQVSAGFQLPVGALGTGDTSFPVVAGFTAYGLLSDLNRYALRVASTSDGGATLTYVVAKRATDIPNLGAAILSLAGVQDQANLKVVSPDSLAELQHVVSGQVGNFARQIALATLAGGLLFVSAIMYANTANRKRDFGRRRALGASRSALIVIVLAGTAVPTIVGVLLGSVVGVATVWVQAGTAPGASLTVAIMAIAVLTGLVAAIPSALASALRDPVRILRVA